MWEEEQKRVDPTIMGHTPISFADLLPHVFSIIEQTHVVADNYKSLERLSYDGEPKIQIAIGGNTLSRGLTFRGFDCQLFCSCCKYV